MSRQTQQTFDVQSLHDVYLYVVQWVAERDRTGVQVMSVCDPLQLSVNQTTHSKKHPIWWGNTELYKNFSRHLLDLYLLTVGTGAELSLLV